MKSKVSWQYCKNPNEINEAIDSHDPNWESLESADQIISIIWNPEHRRYQVFWRVPDDGETFSLYAMEQISEPIIDNTRE